MSQADELEVSARRKNINCLAGQEFGFESRRNYRPPSRLARMWKRVS
jgi:hypothetical protein